MKQKRLWYEEHPVGSWIIHSALFFIMGVVITNGYLRTPGHTIANMEDNIKNLTQINNELSVKYGVSQEQLTSIKKILCDATGEFCPLQTKVELNFCSEEGYRDCKPLFRGEYCVVRKCSTKDTFDVTIAKYDSCNKD